ncbi:unnamed protein product [Zymoseptoria tritici ST99CH_3D7]|uniref:Uncharacterized protein n=1 Tax=Zymoseptoria tritici (strain ST99CH_3D7) TaxID=1276538 RepID=A0A1X7SA16_ZYMT9|nr:unnamed protein product [Zymoseptoria tritici ST99CH_3D7]
MARSSPRMLTARKLTTTKLNTSYLDRPPLHPPLHYVLPLALYHQVLEQDYYHRTTITAFLPKIAMLSEHLRKFLRDFVIDEEEEGVEQESAVDHAECIKSAGSIMFPTQPKAATASGLYDSGHLHKSSLIR